MNSNLEHDYPTLLEAKIRILQAEISVALDQGSLADSAFTSAKDTLMRMLSKESGKQAVQLQVEIANVCVELGKLCEWHLRDLERAGACYSEALQFHPAHANAPLLLAKLQVKQGNHSAAQNQLSGILEKNENSVEASLMMAELLCEKSSFQSAFFHYRKMLETKPSNFEILADFINIAYRLDKLDEVPVYFDKAKMQSAKSKINLGFHYCKGLYLRYIGLE